MSQILGPKSTSEKCITNAWLNNITTTQIDYKRVFQRNYSQFANSIMSEIISRTIAVRFSTRKYCKVQATMPNNTELSVY